MGKLKTFKRKLIIHLGAIVVIPLNSSDWTTVSYRNITPNKIIKKSSTLKIQVNKSASPIVYKLESPIKVTSIKASGRIDGALTLGSSKQGDAGADDFTVRLGLVVKGDKKLNFAQRLIAPKWINELDKLATDTTGITRIEFLNIPHNSLSWSQRVHPLSELLNEIILPPVPTGNFIIDYKLSTPLEVIGIWLSSDGDDTKSSYEVEFKKIELESK